MTTPLMLIVLDGWGYREAAENNAVALGKTPTFDSLLKTYPWTTIEGSGPAVGLPEGVMGNSEVGHMNLGAGRIVRQGLSLIFGAIEDGSFYQNPALLQAVQTAKKNQSTLHLMGLLSNAGVHSHNNHLYALLELAKRESLEKVAIHCFMDGRDTAPNSGRGYLQELQTKIDEIGIGTIATITGRYYAMDRDQRWDRTQLAYEALTEGKGILTTDDPVTAVGRWYAETNPQPAFGDEFVPPYVFTENGLPIATIDDHDAIIFFNFRADRARQMTRALQEKNFSDFKRNKTANLSAYACMMEYHKDYQLPVAFQKNNLTNILAQSVSEAGLKQLHVAETEKYAHVTFFFNGGEETVYPGEERALIQSPKDVATYDLKPEMSAYEVTDTILKALDQDKFELFILNFANPDMVGHTAVPAAVIKAVEVVDECLGKIVEKLLEKKGTVLVLADHGNCEEMVDKEGHPHTQHTLNPVPCILVSAEVKWQQVKLLSKGGKLCDAAPTLLEILGIEKPKEMTGQSLITHMSPRT